MSADVYRILENETKKYFYVSISGVVNANKIRKTFFAITLLKGWSDGVRTIVWDCTEAHFPISFEFNDVYKNVQILAQISITGKPAVFIPPSSEIHQKIFGFYSKLVTTLTKREIEIFADIEQAESWFEKMIEQRKINPITRGGMKNADY
jgi:hypothetical protein